MSKPSLPHLLAILRHSEEGFRSASLGRFQERNHFRKEIIDFPFELTMVIFYFT